MMEAEKAVEAALDELLSDWVREEIDTIDLARAAITALHLAGFTVMKTLQPNPA